MKKLITLIVLCKLTIFQLLPEFLLLKVKINVHGPKTEREKFHICLMDNCFVVPTKNKSCKIMK